MGGLEGVCVVRVCVCVCDERLRGERGGVMEFKPEPSPSN